LLLASPLGILAGPLAIGLSLCTRSMGPFVALGVFQVVWAYSHEVRQHDGFMACIRSSTASQRGAQIPPTSGSST